MIYIYIDILKYYFFVLNRDLYADQTVSEQNNIYAKHTVQSKFHFLCASPFVFTRRRRRVRSEMTIALHYITTVSVCSVYTDYTMWMLSSSVLHSLYIVSAYVQHQNTNGTTYIFVGLHNKKNCRQIGRRPMEFEHYDRRTCSTLCLKKTRHQTLAHNFPKC